MKNVKSGIIGRVSILTISICFFITVFINLPDIVDGTSSQKTIMKVADGITYIDNPNTLNSNSTWSGDYIHFGLTTSNKWRVLERKGTKLLLFSNNILPVTDQTFHATSNVYESSSIRNFLNNEGLLSVLPDARERNLVIPTSIAAKANTEFNSDGTLVNNDWQDGGVVGVASTVSFTNPAVNGDSMYLLSVDEITNPNYGFYRSGSGKNQSRITPSDDRYWLRSAYVDDVQIPAMVDCFPNNGAITTQYECYGQHTVMAAMHIDTADVLYISDAAGGKLSGTYGADAMQELQESTTNDFKFTLKDSNLKLTLSNTSRSGNTFTFDYASSGTVNTISAMLFDANDNIVSYGRIKDISAAADKTGSASVNVPADFDTLGYTLKVFPEMYNGDNATDYAGESTVVTPTSMVEKFKVTFKNHDGSILKEEEVEKGKGASAPTATPLKEGHTFTGWDTSFTNVTAELVVTAQFKINTYTVIFKDYNGTILKNEQVKYNASATAPTVLPDREGYTFTGWDTSFTNVTAELVVTAQFKINTYTVIFKDYNGTILKNEQVKYNASATAPTVLPDREGYTFIGWSEEINNVVGDMEVFAKYSKNTIIDNSTNNEEVPIDTPVLPIPDTKKDNKLEIVDTTDTTAIVSIIYLMSISLYSIAILYKRK